MFNIFKKKIELKNTHSLMESIFYHNGVKVDSEIIVPPNYKCLIYHNSKHYLTLDSGKHILTSSLAPNLFEKQTKNIKRHKSIRAVFHYIYLNEYEVKTTIKKKQYSFTIVITDIDKFAEFILLYNYKTDHTYTVSCIKDLFEYCTKSAPSVENICIYNNHLQKLGFKILKIHLSGSSSIFETQNLYELPNKTQSSPPPITAETNTQINNQVNETLPKCPCCKNEIKFNTTYCLKCGYKL